MPLKPADKNLIKIFKKLIEDEFPDYAPTSEIVPHFTLLKERLFALYDKESLTYEIVREFNSVLS